MFTSHRDEMMMRQFGYFREPPSLTTQNRDAQLKIDPHYTDSRFNEKVRWQTQTVFGPEPKDQSGHPGLNYVYSDRLWQWDRAKADRACDAADKSGAPARSARWFDAFMTEYQGKPCEVRHVMAGVNCSNGYSYYVLGYVELPTENPPHSGAQEG